MAESPEQGALGLGVARVKFPQLGIEQIVEEEGAIFDAIEGRDFRIKPAPALGFHARHKGPAHGLGIAEDAGLDGFVFSGCGHGCALHDVHNEKTASGQADTVPNDKKLHPVHSPVKRSLVSRGLLDHRSAEKA